MTPLETIQDKIPDVAKDLRLNLGAVLAEGSLNEAQRWGVALASAFAARNVVLRDALLFGATAAVGDAVVDDARAAAALMAMNNVYYRFRHIVGKESYTARPARLRMNRLAKVATNKADFELFCLAVSAINGCETCVRSHEVAVLQNGLSEDQVHDAVRIAATVHGVAVALEL